MKSLDARTDIFSLGAVLYEMTTGQQAFPGATSGTIQEAILNRAPVPVARLNPDAPPRLDDVINKALEKDRALRYQSASELRADLQRLKRDSRVRRVIGQRPSAPTRQVAPAGDCRRRLATWRSSR